MEVQLLITILEMNEAQAHAQEKRKRNWENAFQKWSDDNGSEFNNTTSYGCCGCGAMCDYCEDPGYGRPCVRALNAMLRDTGKRIDYYKRDFESVWQGEI